MPNIQFLNPDTLGRPIAPYSNITRVKASEFLFIAGQVGMDKSGKTPTAFEGQCTQVFADIGAALASQGAGFPNIVEFTSYLVHSRTSGNSWNTARANIRACSLAAATRPTRCSSSTGWCARSF
jgi:enamine deaminase RidA (YjgF/YER057c/UK114 family)